MLIIYCEIREEIKGKMGNWTRGAIIKSLYLNHSTWEMTKLLGYLFSMSLMNDAKIYKLVDQVIYC